jgi:RNA polymerase sigma-70 factor (ECF subfamily)
MSVPEADLNRRFLRLFASHEQAVRAFVRRLVPQWTDADDVMQDVSVVLWEKFPALPESQDFRVWAFGVARYEVLAWLRDKGRDRLVLTEDVVLEIAEESVMDEPKLERQREALELSMSKVQPVQRELLMQAYQPDFCIQEVARSSGRSLAGFYQ